MTPHEFWHEDMRLLTSYQKAYYSRTSYEQWLNGYYTNIAFGITMSNSFAKKGSKPKEYPKWENPTDKMFKKNEYKNIDVEQEFRKQQIEQSAWLFNRK